MGFASWQRYCMVLQQWASAKLCSIEQRAPPIFGRATITLGIDPHSSFFWLISACLLLWTCRVKSNFVYTVLSDWLGRTSLKWFIYVLSGMWNLNSLSQSSTSIVRLEAKYVRRGSVMVRTVDLQVDSWSFYASGQVIHVCLSQQTVRFGIGQRTVILCGWEGNRTSDSIVAIRHRYAGACMLVFRLAADNLWVDHIHLYRLCHHLRFYATVEINREK